MDHDYEFHSLNELSVDNMSIENDESDDDLMNDDTENQLNVTILPKIGDKVTMIESHCKVSLGHFARRSAPEKLAAELSLVFSLSCTNATSLRYDHIHRPTACADTRAIRMLM